MDLKLAHSRIVSRKRQTFSSRWAKEFKVSLNQGVAPYLHLRISLDLKTCKLHFAAKRKIAKQFPKRKQARRKYQTSKEKTASTQVFPPNQAYKKKSYFA